MLTRAATGVTCEAVPASPPAPPPSDADLARRIGAGGERARPAERELCLRFAPRIRAYGLRHLRSEALADDLVQLTLELTLTKLRGREVKQPDRIASFVLGCARLQSLALHRHGKREAPLGPEQLESLPSEARAEPRPLATDRLAACLAKLAERQRSVVVCAFFDDQTAAEIAASLGTSEGNVRVIRHRAVEQLRRCMGLEERAP